jgi:hypothetical protein
MTVESIIHQLALGPPGKSTRVTYRKGGGCGTTANDLLLKQTMEKYQRGAGILLKVSNNAHGE